MSSKSMLILSLCFLPIALFCAGPSPSPIRSLRKASSVPTESGRFKSIFNCTNAIQCFGFMAGAGSSYAAVRDQDAGVPLSKNIWAMCSGLGVCGAFANYCWVAQTSEAELRAKRSLDSIQARVGDLEGVCAAAKWTDIEDEDRKLSLRIVEVSLCQTRSECWLDVKDHQREKITELHNSCKYKELKKYVLDEIVNPEKRTVELEAARIEQKNLTRENDSLLCKSFVAGTCAGAFGAKVRLTPDDRVRSFRHSSAK